MRILLTTPLYPPEIAESAQYIKELAKRLHCEGHAITIITYSDIPEKISGVQIITINKYMTLPERLTVFTQKLWNTMKTTDVIYTENGASVELPVALVSLFTHKPLIMHIGDKGAFKRSHESFLLRHIHSFATVRANAIIENTPLQRPEILPFKEASSDEQAQYKTSWQEHVNSLLEIFKHAQK